MRHTEEEIKKLRQENEILRFEVEANRLIQKSFAGFSLLIIAGPTLIKALKEFLTKALKEKHLPIEETAQLGAAITKRLIRVGVIGFVVAILPSLIMGWQSYLLREQNKNFAEFQMRNENNQELRQILAELEKLEESDFEGTEITPVLKSRIARLTNNALLDVKYKDFNRKVSSVRGILLSALVAKAVSADQIAEFNFTFSDLRRVKFHDINLSAVNLQGSYLRHADFKNSNLYNVTLEDCFLKDSSFFSVNLANTYFGNEKDLIDVPFRYCNFNDSISWKSFEDYTKYGPYNRTNYSIKNGAWVIMQHTNNFVTSEKDRETLNELEIYYQLFIHLGGSIMFPNDSEEHQIGAARLIDGEPVEQIEKEFEEKTVNALIKAPEFSKALWGEFESLHNEMSGKKLTEYIEKQSIKQIHRLKLSKITMFNNISSHSFYGDPLEFGQFTIENNRDLDNITYDTVQLKTIAELSVATGKIQEGIHIYLVLYNYTEDDTKNMYKDRIRGILLRYPQIKAPKFFYTDTGIESYDELNALLSSREHVTLPWKAP